MDRRRTRTDIERRWTRRRTVFGDEVRPADLCRDDWCVHCDGHLVGRIMLTRGGPQDGRWLGAVQTHPGHSSYADTLEAALAVIRQGTSFGEGGRPNWVDVWKERAARSRSSVER